MSSASRFRSHNVLYLPSSSAYVTLVLRAFVSFLSTLVFKSVSLPLLLEFHPFSLDPFASTPSLYHFFEQPQNASQASDTTCRQCLVSSFSSSAVNHRRSKRRVAPKWGRNIF